jgi:pimeloyl-ACP methyl ester carboxylesterase
MSEISLNYNSAKSSFVLVHAAWQGPYAWDLVKEHLLQAGFAVEVLQLPGHGTDTTDPRNIHMDTYVKYVSNAVSAAGKKVILVGHSLAGMIISGVAEEIPDMIEKLVFIAAYVPVNGQSAYAISMLDQQSLLGASLLVSEDQTEFNIVKEDVTNIFCQDGSEAVKQLILANYRAEPAAPFSDPVELSNEHFGRVTKYYVETLRDNGIGNKLQKDMIAAAKIDKVFSVDSSHTPALSQPGEIAKILIALAENS